MRHYITAAMIVLIVIANSVSVKAEKNTKPQIYAGQPEKTSEEDIDTPIQIKNNSGLMGFVLYLEYNEQEIDIKTVTKGKLTKEGIFEANPREKNGRAMALWSSASEVKEDGELMRVTLSLKKNISTTDIRVRYSPDDTFDESYQNTSLECSKITITSDKPSSKDQSGKTSDVKTQKKDEANTSGNDSESNKINRQEDQHIEVKNIFSDKQKGSDDILIEDKNQVISKLDPIKDEQGELLQTETMEDTDKVGNEDANSGKSLKEANSTNGTEGNNIEANNIEAKKDADKRNNTKKDSWIPVLGIAVLAGAVVGSRICYKKIRKG